MTCDRSLTFLLIFLHALLNIGLFENTLLKRWHNQTWLGLMLIDLLLLMNLSLRLLFWWWDKKQRCLRHLPQRHFDLIYWKKNTLHDFINAVCIHLHIWLTSCIEKHEVKKIAPGNSDKRVWIHYPVIFRQHLCPWHTKLTLEGQVKCRSLKLKVRNQAAVFGALGVNMRSNDWGTEVLTSIDIGT